MMRLSFRAGLLAALAVCLAAGNLRAADGISIENATARPTFVANGVSAAYFLIKNSTSVPDRLLSAKSPVANITEVHTVIREGKKCVPRKLANLGEACGAGQGPFCTRSTCDARTQKCVALPGEGEACDAATECAAPLRCLDKHCGMAGKAACP